MKYVIGQRWISHTEPQLGLGIIAESAGRRVTISFPAIAEQRIYAGDNAPLSRIIYKPGDTVFTLDDIELTITAVEELRGILLYTGVDGRGQERTIAELDLNCFVQFTTPRQRLLSGQFDKDSSYQLRMATLIHRGQLQGSGVRGLLGTRTSLLPHQIHIASEVARRYAPRVLLADEVGLGKTIEAGMILHQQLLTARAGRVLIVVPPTLLHQWLVEMLRRFNLRFALFDRERYQALRQEQEDHNPFHSEQLILCSLEFLCSDEAIQQQAAAADWDLLVIDEAHHLHWSERSVSAEYLCVERLSAHSKGLLLLTATPEQLGIASHFARLRLLDPSRFHQLSQFEQEEAGYQQLNLLVQELLGTDGKMYPALAQRLRDYLGDQVDELEQGNIELETVLRQLLDRHGTGRVLFRNTRAAIGGFPERHLKPHALPRPEIYQSPGTAWDTEGLYPEIACDDAEWLRHDPRIPWLEGLLRQLRPDKVLIICAHASTAVALEYQLHLRAGIRSAAFHQGLSIVERDRAAAWFAEHDNGAQALVCSEVGSEGRNFQFAHHLVLFDLPLNPDLLEQRIGRLDRIGQRQAIDIHVPYLQDSAQEVLFHWYHEGIGLFEHSCSVAYSIFEQFEARLRQQLEQPDDDLAALISDTASFTLETRQALQQGRDPLLELSSCNPQQARAQIEAIEAAEDSPALRAYMETLFDQFGVEHDFHSEHALVLRPGEQMLSDHFPGLPDTGSTVTFDRQHALSREDMEFLSWEHPMVSEAMDMVLHSQLGNAAVSSIDVRGLATGTILLETCFALSCPAPEQLQLSRYLPPSPVRLLVDSKCRDLSEVLSHQQLNQLCTNIKRSTAAAIIKSVRDDIERMIDTCERIASSRLPDILRRANANLVRQLTEEADRLTALQQHNPSIRNEEINFFRAQIRDGQHYLNKADFNLEAVRVVVNT
jgi:ATP-dependent helicase HepA